MESQRLSGVRSLCKFLSAAQSAKSRHACVPSRSVGAAVLFASANAAMEVEQTEVSKANVPETPSWGRALAAHEGVAKRSLRAGKTTTEECEDKEDSEEEERVLPGTDLAAQLAPKLEKVLSNKQLVATTATKEWWQFALWFIQGKSPRYVAENVLKINPRGSTGKAVAMYHRYVQYFQKYKFTGIRFHTGA